MKLVLLLHCDVDHNNIGNAMGLVKFDLNGRKAHGCVEPRVAKHNSTPGVVCLEVVDDLGECKAKWRVTLIKSSQKLHFQKKWGLEPLNTIIVSEILAQIWIFCMTLTILNFLVSSTSG